MIFFHTLSDSQRTRKLLLFSIIMKSLICRLISCLYSIMHIFIFLLLFWLFICLFCGIGFQLQSALLFFMGRVLVSCARDISITLICNAIFDNILFYKFLYLNIDLGSTVLNWKFRFSVVPVNNSLFFWSLRVILKFRVVRGPCYSTTWNFFFFPVLNCKFKFSMVTAIDSMFSWSLWVILDFRVMRSLCYSITWNFFFLVFL